MDPVRGWTHVPEVKPLNVRRGFLAGLAVAVAVTITTALAGRALVDIAAVAVAGLAPVMLVTLLIIRTNRRISGHGSR